MGLRWGGRPGRRTHLLPATLTTRCLPANHTALPGREGREKRAWLPPPHYTPASHLTPQREREREREKREREKISPLALSRRNSRPYPTTASRAPLPLYTNTSHRTAAFAHGARSRLARASTRAMRAHALRALRLRHAPLTCFIRQHMPASSYALRMYSFILWRRHLNAASMPQASPPRATTPCARFCLLHVADRQARAALRPTPAAPPSGPTLPPVSLMPAPLSCLSNAWHAHLPLC